MSTITLMAVALLSYLVAIVLFVLPLHAEDTREWIGATQRSYIQLHEPHRDGAVATVTFQNEAVHTAGDVERFDLTWQDITIEVHFDYQGGAPDTVFVIPPEGLVALPQEISVPDRRADKIHLYAITQMGM